MKEWPLVVFTSATQLACGLALAATVFDAQVPASAAGPMRPLAELYINGDFLEFAQVGQHLYTLRSGRRLVLGRRIPRQAQADPRRPPGGLRGPQGLQRRRQPGHPGRRQP